MLGFAVTLVQGESWGVEARIGPGWETQGGDSESPGGGWVGDELEPRCSFREAGRRQQD